MGFYNIIDKHLLLPMGDFAYGSDISRQWEVLNRSEFLPYQQILEIQNEKLRKLIRHAYDSVPYYHKLFDKLGLRPEDIQTKDDLSKLPILTKQIIRDNYDDMFSTAVDPKRFRKSSSGGSTGTPLRFCTDNHEWSMQRASTLRAWESYGLKLGDKVFSLGGDSIARKKNAFSLKNVYDLVIMRNYKYNSSDVDQTGMAQHLENFKRIRPKAVRGYGSSLVIFARYLKEEGYKPSGIKVVLTTGEVLMPNYRISKN